MKQFQVEVVVHQMEMGLQIGAINMLGAIELDHQEDGPLE